MILHFLHAWFAWVAFGVIFASAVAAYGYVYDKLSGRRRRP